MDMKSTEEFCPVQFFIYDILLPSVLSAANAVDWAFSEYLLLSNIVSAGLLLGFGDLLVQTVDNLNQDDNRKWHYDFVRNRRAIIVGHCLGVFNHVWYNFLDGFLHDTTLTTVLKKIALDQTIAGPFFCTAFFVGMGILEGKGGYDIFAELRGKFIEIYKADWMFWPAAQFINFYLIPHRFRVFYVNFATLLWNTFLSYMKHRDKEQRPTRRRTVNRTSSRTSNRKGSRSSSRHRSASGTKIKVTGRTTVCSGSRSPTRSKLRRRKPKVKCSITVPKVPITNKVLTGGQEFNQLETTVLKHLMCLQEGTHSKVLKCLYAPKNKWGGSATDAQPMENTMHTSIRILTLQILPEVRAIHEEIRLLRETQSKTEEKICQLILLHEQQISNVSPMNGTSRKKTKSVKTVSKSNKSITRGSTSKKKPPAPVIID